MASPFDDGWSTPDAFLSTEMGEAISIGGVPVADAVVPEVGGGSRITGLVAGSGVAFTVLLSRAQITALGDTTGQGVLGIKGRAVVRGAFKGRVVAVRDLGGAGAELGVGPAGDR